MRYLMVLSAFWLLGCASEEVPAPAPPPAPPLQEFTVTFPALTVMPGVENTQCVVLKLGNTGPLHIGQIHNILGPASHHMIIYRVDDTVEQPQPFDCQPFLDTLDPRKGAPLMITQKRDDLLTLPSGVAYSLQANQMLRLEMHYINASPDPVTLTASSTLTEAPEFHDEADFLFIGDPDIKMPAHATSTLGPIFYQLDPDVFSGVNFFAFTGHEHRLGTNVTVQAAATADDTTGPMVYDVANWQWSEPETVRHDPPVQVPANGGFRFTCEWNNTSDNEVHFGESANDEMCFFWAYYYPSRGAYVCIHTVQFGGHEFCCPGGAECAFIGQYEGGP